MRRRLLTAATIATILVPTLPMPRAVMADKVVREVHQEIPFVSDDDIPPHREAPLASAQPAPSKRLHQHKPAKKARATLLPQELHAIFLKHFRPEHIALMTSIADCESDFDPTLPNAEGSGAKGLFQIMYWEERAKKAGIPGANWQDPEANTKVAAYLLYNGGGVNLSHWKACL